MFGSEELERERLLKQTGFNLLLKHERVGVVRISSGKLFHSLGAS